MTQAPTTTSLTERELLDDRADRWRGPAFALAPRIVRRKKLTGESEQQAKARWDREAELERDRDEERRRVFTGQVLPVFLDDGEI
jgi:hypothetical protein